MAQTYIQPGDTLDYTVPSGGVTSGDVVISGTNFMGIALGTGVENDIVSVKTEGVFEMAKEAPLAIAIYAKVYWDADNETVTTDSEGGSPWGDFPLVGRAAAAGTLADTTINVKLSQA